MSDASQNDEFAPPPPAPALPPQPPFTQPPLPAPGYAVPPAQGVVPSYGAQVQPYTGYPAATPVGQQPYAQPYGAYAPAPLERSGAAVAALVCGIIGLLGFWFWLPGILSIVAIISGHYAVRTTRRDPTIGGRGMAFVGLILGYVGAGLVLFQLVFVVGALLIFGAFVPTIFSR